MQREPLPECNEIQRAPRWWLWATVALATLVVLITLVSWLRLFT